MFLAGFATGGASVMWAVGYLAFRRFSEGGVGE